jgi:hypothetical protein
MSSVHAAKPEGQVLGKWHINTQYSSMHWSTEEAMWEMVAVPLPNAWRLLSLRPFVFQTCWSIKLPVSVLFFFIPNIFCCNTGITLARSAGIGTVDYSYTFWTKGPCKLSLMSHILQQYTTIISRCYMKQKTRKHSNERSDKIHNIGSQVFLPAFLLKLTHGVKNFV